MKLTGKVALVTGGGSGIGAAITERFIAEGAKVCITGRRQAMLDQVLAALPAESATACSGDVAKQDDIAKMVETTVAFGGRLDVLVNNAGVSTQGSVGDMDLDTWRQVMDTNLTGPLMLMKACIPYMLKNDGGSIINIASVGGLRCLPGMPAYCSSKAALIMLTQQTALDYGPQNIRCNAVCPGGVKTEMVEKEWGRTFGKMLGMTSDDFFDLIAAEIPLRRFGQAKEVAGMCAYLASDDASFVTGASLVVDAGTAIVDVVGASIMGALRRGKIMP